MDRQISAVNWGAWWSSWCRSSKDQTVAMGSAIQVRVQSFIFFSFVQRADYVSQCLYNRDHVQLNGHFDCWPRVDRVHWHMRLFKCQMWSRCYWLLLARITQVAKQTAQGHSFVFGETSSMDGHLKVEMLKLELVAELKEVKQGVELLKTEPLMCIMVNFQHSV